MARLSCTNVRRQNKHAQCNHVKAPNTK